MSNIRKFLVLSCLLVIVISIFNIVSAIVSYKNIEQKNEELIEDYTTTVYENNLEENTVDLNDPLYRKIDFKALTSRNDDVIGWLYIPNTNIDEVVMKSKDNSDYLHHDIDHNYSYAGQIFVDYRNDLFNDANTIIHGHNMLNNTRFGDIKNIRKQDLNNYPFLYLYLPDNSVWVYNIVSINMVDGNSAYYYSKDIDVKEYIDTVINNAIVFNDVPVNSENVLTLSTCVDTTSDNRYILVALLKEKISQ